jgi:hypothetical protein
MLATNDTLSDPFTLLAAVVRDYHLNGRRALGATLKPDLYRRFRLTEQQLGYAKFGDFLRAAERAGFVSVVMTLGGDLEVFPPSASVPPAQQKMFVDAPPRPVLPVGSVSPQAVLRDDASVRVRVDLWNAFTSYSARWVYDPIHDRAVRVLAGQSDPVILGGGQPISIPAGRERTLGWMRAFAEMQDPEPKSRLLAALDGGETTPYQFNSTLRSSMKMLKAWQKYHVRQVVAAIETWAASNNLKPKDVTTPYVRRPQPYWPVVSLPAQVDVPRAIEVSTTSVQGLPAAPSVPASVTTAAALASLTPRLATLVDELIDELLRLRGALQVIDPKR